MCALIWLLEPSFCGTENNAAQDSFVVPAIELLTVGSGVALGAIPQAFGSISEKTNPIAIIYCRGRKFTRNDAASVRSMTCQ